VRHVLQLEFCGETWALEPGDELTFGKEGDLVVDERDEYLHRRLGRISWADGRWWLHNTGARMTLAVEDARTPSYKQLSPGVADVLNYPEFFIRFRTRRSQYEIAGVVADTDAREPVPGTRVASAAVTSATHTRSWGVVELNENERQMLVALSRRRLLAGQNASPELPSNEDVCRELGWNVTTFNRRLDHLCWKLAEAGVTGLVGGDNKLARDRRHVLVAHALRTGLVTRSDLDERG
jgi:hypothetical protein